MSGLTDEQRAAFNARMEALGLKPADAIEHIDTGATPGPTVLHTDPDRSDHPPAGFITASSIRELKDKLGVADGRIESGEVSDAHVDYPAELSSNLKALHADAKDGCELERRLNDELPQDNLSLLKARLAFMQGHSGKVASYEPVINAISFPQPMQVPVLAALNVTVRAGSPLVLKSDDGKPVVVNFGTVTVEAGGEIQVIGGSISWTSQVFIQQ